MKQKTKSKRKKTTKTFRFHPEDPKRSFDVYIDKNPEDTIPIKYTTVEDVARTIRRLERLYKAKQYSHKRIWQVGMILMVRLRVLRRKKPEQYALALRYFRFLQGRTDLSQRERYKARFIV